MTEEEAVLIADLFKVEANSRALADIRIANTIDKLTDLVVKLVDRIEELERRIG